MPDGTKYLDGELLVPVLDDLADLYDEEDRI